MTKANHSPSETQTGNSLPSSAIDFLPGLSPTTRRIWQVLSDHAKGRGRCWPSRKRIAAMAGCCLRSVSNATRKLESLGLLRRVSVYDSHRQTPNTYYLLDLSPIESILSPVPPKPTPRQYVPGEPKLSTPLFCKGRTLPILNPKGDTPHTPRQDVERPSSLPQDGPRIAQDKRSPRQTGKAIDPQPHSREEAAAWSRALDEPVGFSDWPANRKKLRQILDIGGVALLQRLLDLALQPWIKSPGAYLQVLVRNVF